MNIYVLRPVGYDKNEDELPRCFDPWYDKAFGVVIRAESETIAREMATSEGGDEIYTQGEGNPLAWKTPAITTCDMIAENVSGTRELIMRDFRSA